MLKNQRLTLALALALGSSQAFALGLGTIDVRSKLNEQLVAEIPILGSNTQEIDALQVRLASAEAFSRVGIDRPTILSANLQFSVDTDKKGNPVIRVTTPSKVRDPFLNFLIEIEWGRGRLMREFTVLLDPPVIAKAKIAPATAPPRRAEPARPSAPPQPAPSQDLAKPPEMAAPSTPAPATPAARPEATTAPATEPQRPVQSALAKPVEPKMDYGPVQEGETLWSIAQRMRPNDQVSMDQMMIAIQAINPEAFIDGNINRLKRGAVLRIPSSDQLAAVGQQAAAAQVIEQSREWRALAEQSTSTLQPEAPAATRPRTEPANARDRARLELVPPRGEVSGEAAQSGAAAGGQGAELRAELTRTREQLEAAEQEATELQSRVSDLESMQQNQQKLIDLKDSQLAEAQSRIAELEAQRGEDSTSASAAVDMPDESSEPDEATSPAGSEPVAMSEPEPAPAEPLPAEQPAATPAPAQPAAADTSAAEAEKPWYLQPLNLGLLLAGLAGIVLAGLTMQAKRRKAQAQSQGGGNGRKSSIADSFSSGAGAAVAVASQNVDEEGRLLDAIGEQPDDLNHHLALVRYYYERDDVSAFEGAVEAMNAQVFDPEDMRWKQVEAMGRELLPDHPLFIAATQPPPAAAAPAQDLSWDAEPASAQATEPAATPSDVDWSSGDSATTGSFAMEDIERMAASQDDSGGIDFEPAADEMPSASSFDVSRDELVGGEASLDLDMESGSGAGENNEEAAATKLELARAYLDMGDVEGARGMLEEVVQEGNPGQRAEAKRLIDEIR
ncbi:MAG: hypothetical protein KDJ14_16605 [Xanthomonadales bacterium]|nr:hypothetical protein [Xanthomonadales bacterium]